MTALHTLVVYLDLLLIAAVVMASIIAGLYAALLAERWVARRRERQSDAHYAQVFEDAYYDEQARQGLRELERLGEIE